MIMLRKGKHKEEDFIGCTHIYSLSCLKVVLKLSVPEYILALKTRGTPLVLALVRRGYSTAKP